MGKVRAISFSFDGKSVVRRQVGKTLEILLNEEVVVITISQILVEEHPINGVLYKIYGVNSKGEEGLWKEVYRNMEVEHDITDLLCDQ